jgi:hypothetical protein
VAAGMVLNIGVRTGWLRAFAVAVAGSSLLGACAGGSEFTYLESEDGHAFAKIPSEWTVLREGAIAWALLNEQNPSLGFVEGDSTTPWRAVFSASPDGAITLDRPAGMIEIQHIDARIRDNFDVGELVRTVPTFGEAEAGIAQEDLDVLDRRQVRIGDLRGYRVRVGSDELERQFDQLVLTDSERRAFYLVSVSCSEDCLDRYQGDIDEVLTTFEVQ